MVELTKTISNVRQDEDSSDTYLYKGRTIVRKHTPHGAILLKSARLRDSREERRGKTAGRKNARKTDQLLRREIASLHPGYVSGVKTVSQVALSDALVLKNSTTVADIWQDLLRGRHSAMVIMSDLCHAINDSKVAVHRSFGGHEHAWVVWDMERWAAGARIRTDYAQRVIGQLVDRGLVIRKRACIGKSIQPRAWLRPDPVAVLAARTHARGQVEGGHASQKFDDIVSSALGGRWQNVRAAAERRCYAVLRVAAGETDAAIVREAKRMKIKPVLGKDTLTWRDCVSSVLRERRISPALPWIDCNEVVLPDAYLDRVDKAMVRFCDNNGHRVTEHHDTTWRETEIPAWAHDASYLPDVTAEVKEVMSDLQEVREAHYDLTETRRRTKDAIARRKMLSEAAIKFAQRLYGMIGSKLRERDNPSPRRKAKKSKAKRRIRITRTKPRPIAKDERLEKSIAHETMVSEAHTVENLALREKDPSAWACRGAQWVDSSDHKRGDAPSVKSAVSNHVTVVAEECRRRGSAVLPNLRRYGFEAYQTSSPDCPDAWLTVMSDYTYDPLEGTSKAGLWNVMVSCSGRVTFFSSDL